eukprot:gene8728-676_t
MSFLKKYKTQQDIDEHVIIKTGEVLKYSKPIWVPSLFYLTSEGKLFITMTTKKKYEEIVIHETYQKIYNETFPFSVKLKTKESFAMLSFPSYKEYTSFLQKIIIFDIKQELTIFSEIKSKIETSNVANWSHNQVLEWLSFLIFENKDLPWEIENIFISKKFTGNDLLFLQKKNFIEMGVSENISNFLDKEINILLISNGFNLSKKKFQFKLEGFSDYKHLDSKNFLKKHKDKVFSLCDEKLILKSYLNLDIENYDELIFSKEEFECRLVLSEMVYNSYDMGLADSFKSKINSLNFFDPNSKFGNFKCSLIIGDLWYLEFGDTSICVPKKIGGNIKKLYDQIPPFSKIKLKIDEIRTKLAKVITEWNCNFMYKKWDPKLSKFEGNHFHFVEEIFKEFQIDTKYNGSMYSFMNEIKNFGDAGPSIYPTDYSTEFQEKFGFSCIPEIHSHDEFDEFFILVNKNEPKFKKKYPHDYLIFQAFDVAFMLRSLKSKDENFEPLVDVESELVCPNIHLLDYEFVSLEEQLKSELVDSPCTPSPKRKNDTKRKSVSNQRKSLSSRKSLSNSRKSISEKSLKTFEKESKELSKDSRFSQTFRDRSTSKDGITSRLDRLSMSILKTLKSNPK